jgi:hypothetical protein
MAEEAPSDGIVRGGFCFCILLFRSYAMRLMGGAAVVKVLFGVGEEGRSKKLEGRSGKLRRARLRDARGEETHTVRFNGLTGGTSPASTRSQSKARLTAIPNSIPNSTYADRSVRATHVTYKRLGERAEAAFLAKVAGLGFGVAKPWGDSDRYDFIVDAGGKLRRVQVKSAHKVGADGGYSLRLFGHSVGAYKEDEIDFLVCYLAPEDAWYVFPPEVFRGRRSVKLFGGSVRKRSKFEVYREAWGWLSGGSAAKAAGSGKV